MRLRLTIRRHALPDTSLIWPLTPEEENDLTVAGLVERVNEVVPLESEESNWGLEDYVVEVPGRDGPAGSGGFECLHFGVVGKVVRDDEVVVIRPLLTQDTRIRRASGRHQISGDGMKLIDGVPFGRPRPLLQKRYWRPEVEIPPLKRRRITFDEEEGGDDVFGEEEGNAEEGNGETQLLLKDADFEDEDEEDDEDFVPGEGEEEEFNPEKEDDINPEEGDEIMRMDEEDELLDGSGSDAESSASEEHNPLFDHYDKHGLPRGSIKSGKALEHMAKVLGESSKSGAKSNGSSKSKKEKRSSLGRGKKVVFDDDESEEPEVEVEDTNPVGAEELKEVEEDHEVDEDEESSGDESEDESSSDGSSDDDSDSDDDSPTGPGAGASKNDESSADKDDSSDLSSTSDSSASSDSDSDSDSDAEPEEVSSKTTTPGTGVSVNTKITPQTPSTQAPQAPPKRIVPPHQGKKSTRSRNERRRNTHMLKRMQDKGIIPAGTTLKQYNELGLGNVTTAVEAHEALKAKEAAQSDVAPEVTGESANAEFEARRKQLLESLASGGIEVGPEAAKARKQQQREAIEARRQQLYESLASECVEVRRETAKSPKQQQGEAIQEPADVEMGNTALPTVVLPQTQADDNENPKEASIALEKRTPPPLPGESADKDMETPTVTPYKPHGPYNPPVGKEDCLKGMTFVFTGQLESMSRNQGRELIAKYGGKVVPNPTLKTNYVVLGSNVGETKLRKIENMKLNTIDKEGLFELIAKSAPATKGKSTGSGKEIPETPAGEVTAVATSTKKTPDTVTDTPESGAQGRRTKLDVGAGRRLLFGALGIKAPKTKADEEKVRSDLMKFAKPVKAVEEPTVPEVQEAPVDEDPDAWREKINLSAVECCHDGVELSEPPFPFVQRWDPQQQGSWPSKGGRGGKRKRNKRDRTQYYEDEPQGKSHGRKRQKGWDHDEFESSFLQEEQSYVEDYGMELNYDEPAQTNEGPDPNAIDAGRVAYDDTQAPDLDDLQSLPSDLSTLPKFNASDAKAGMVIAFKHLIMGPNYQPQYSNYKTAAIIRVEDSGDLQLGLAKRDREQKEYDPETGERVFGMFEMPVDDDEEDDGVLCLGYAALVDPLIVQNAPEDLFPDEEVEKLSVFDDDAPDNHDADQNPDGQNFDNGNQASNGNAEDAQGSNGAPTEGAKGAAGEKQPSTDNSTTMDHENPEKSVETSLDQDSPIKSIEENVEEEALEKPDSPMKSIEDNIEKEAAEKPIQILTEDLLQKSAEGSFLEAEGEAHAVEEPESDSLKDGSPRPSLRGSDQMEIDVEADESLLGKSLGEEDQSTPRLTRSRNELKQTNLTRKVQSSPRTTPRRNDELEHEVQVQQTDPEQKTPIRNGFSTPRPGLGGGDGSNETEIEDTFSEEPVIQQEQLLTPRRSSRLNTRNSVQSSPNSITESARHDVSIMMREAGFRSDIPSSILRGNQLNVYNTPGDAAVFEKLMREMAPDTDRASFSSPRSRGFASSSPVKAREKDLEMSPTPVAWEKPTFATPKSNRARAAGAALFEEVGAEKELEMSPTPVTWENPTFESPESTRAQATTQSFETEESQSIKYPKLQDLSSYTSPGDHGRQPESDFRTDQSSFRPSEEFDSLVRVQDELSSLVGAEVEAEEFPSAQPSQYPEVRSQDLTNPLDELDSLMRRQDEQSSLARAKADAERFQSPQPLINSDAMQQDPSSPLSQLAGNMNDSPPPMPEPQSPPRRSPSLELPKNRRVSSSSNKDSKKKKKKAVTPEPVSDFYPSSDASMPTLEEVMSQPRIKSEPRASQPLFMKSQLGKSKADEEYEAAMAKHDAIMYDSDPDALFFSERPRSRNRASSFQKPPLLVPKKEFRAVSASQVPREIPRASRPPRPSQASRFVQPPKFSESPRLSQAPRPSQPPPGSQMIDLTLSSDEEPEAGFSTAPVEVYHDSDKDSDYQYSGPTGSGWVSKKKVSSTTVTTRGKSLEPTRARRVTTGGDTFQQRVSSTQADISSTKWKGRKGEGQGQGVKEEGRRKTMGMER